MRWQCNACLLLAAIALSAAGLLYAGEPEASVTAAFVLNFAKFTQWPPMDAVEKRENFQFCFVGLDNERAGIENRLKNESVRKVPVELRFPAFMESLETCQVVYVSGLSRKKLALFKDELQRPGLLTIGESEAFMAEGGIIRLYTQRGKILFEIEPERALQKKLKISSRLLRLTTIKIRSDH